MLVGMEKLVKAYVGPLCSVRYYEGVEALTCAHDLNFDGRIFYVSAGNALYSKLAAEKALRYLNHRRFAERVAGVVLVGSCRTWLRLDPTRKTVACPWFFQEVSRKLWQTGVPFVQADGSFIRDKSIYRDLLGHPQKSHRWQFAEHLQVALGQVLELRPGEGATIAE